LQAGATGRRVRSAPPAAAGGQRGDGDPLDLAGRRHRSAGAQRPARYADDALRQAARPGGVLRRGEGREPRAKHELHEAAPEARRGADLAGPHVAREPLQKQHGQLRAVRIAQRAPHHAGEVGAHAGRRRDADRMARVRPQLRERPVGGIAEREEMQRLVARAGGVRGAPHATPSGPAAVDRVIRGPGAIVDVARHGVERGEPAEQVGGPPRHQGGIVRVTHAQLGFARVHRGGGVRVRRGDEQRRFIETEPCPHGVEQLRLQLGRDEQQVGGEDRYALSGSA